MNLNHVSMERLSVEDRRKAIQIKNEREKTRSEAEQKTGQLKSRTVLTTVADSTVVRGRVRGDHGTVAQTQQIAT